MEAEKRKALSLYLRDIRDPRRRQGRIYPLASILTMLTLAAVNGESTLRGIRRAALGTNPRLARAGVGRESATVWDAMERDGWCGAATSGRSGESVVEG